MPTSKPHKKSTHKKKPKVPLYVSVRWVANTHGASYMAVRRAAESGALRPVAAVENSTEAGISGRRAPVFEKAEASRWARAWKKGPTKAGRKR